MFALETEFTPTPTSAADALLHGMNTQQAEAIRHTEGPLLVLAGAGTGKTAVLTRRIAYLLMTQSAQPHEIMAVTFTNKAAKEMAERTEKLIGFAPSGMWLGTFHSLGVRMLRQHAERAGLKPGFAILDSDDQQRLIGQLVKDSGLDTTQWPARLVTSLINRWKDHGWGPTTVPTDELGNLGARGSALYAEYQRRLQSLNAVDFGDLLLRPLQLLTQHADLAEQYQNRLRYILVDEYQDTNTVQYNYLKMLAAKHKNICVVGDDDQSIYSWRGAQVANILRFEHDFDGATVIRLEQNYRSTGHILAAANGVIGHNRQRHGKQLWTDAGDGSQLELHPQLDDREEARFVADAAALHVRSGGRHADVAVLVRTAAQTRSLEEAFMRNGLPYVVVGGLRFYERKEIKDALGYLRLIANPADDLAFQRIVNVPKRGVGETSMEKIEALARQHGISQLVATRRLVESGDFTGKIGNSLLNLLGQLENWSLLAQMQTPDQLAERILEESGYFQMLRDDKAADGDTTDSKVRLDNLKELLRALQDYPDLPSFLEHAALVADIDTAPDADTVKMMTIHAAKGLEFPLVFLPGFEEGLFPNQRALNEEGNKGLEEERRLAYVAITRARKRCVLSYANARRMWGQFLPGAPSRFIAEIPPEHLKTVSGALPYRSPYGGGMGGFGAPRARVGSVADARSTRAGSDYTRPAEPLVAYSTPLSEGPRASLSNAAWQVGQSVFHQKFGNGRVEAVEGSGEATKLTITFKHAGTKKLVAAMANLEVK